MDKIILSRKEKTDVLSILKYISPTDLSIDVFQKINIALKVPITLIELTILHLENLFCLQTIQDKIVFKGGTAVQNYISDTFQRCSVDLDFNTSLHHPEQVKSLINDLNRYLEEKKMMKKIKGIPYGLLLFEKQDIRSGTLTYSRLMPSRLNEFIKFQETLVQGKKMRIQINYKHAWMPALKTKRRKISIFPVKYISTIDTSYKINICSTGDLLADKILTLTQIGHFGRERLKDVYDLILLTKYYRNKLPLAKQKLEKIADMNQLSYSALLETSIDHLHSFKDDRTKILGLKSQVAIEGKKLVDSWDLELDSLIEALETINV